MPAIFSRRYTAYLFLLLNTVLWGFASPIIKYSLDYTSPTLFLFYRYLIAAFIFFPFFLVHSSKNHRRMNLKQLILLALIGTPLTLYPLYVGLAATSAIQASILVSSGPIFVVLGGIIYLKEKIRRKEWIGIILALVGTLLLAIEPITSGQSGLNALSLEGNILILVSNIIWAVFLVISKKDHVDPISLTFVSFVISIPFFLAALLFEGHTLSINPQALPGIFYMAIFGSIIAFWAYIEGQKRIEASEAAIFTYLQPVFSIPLAMVWLKEPFTPLSIIATAVIVIGVFFSEKRF